MTKIDVFSGFLGAGKTTLIRKLLKEAYAGQKVVLIENEFGEIGIDGGFLKEAGVEVTEMNSGCICCSLVGDFEKALLEVLSRFEPDRILIEPSGVGKLSDVVGAIKGVLSDSVTLGSLVTVADATKCKLYIKNFGEFYNDQIGHAEAIVLSRTYGMNEDKLEAAVAQLRERNEHATIVTTPWEQLDGAQLLSAIEQGKTLADEMDELKAELEHHHHDEHCHCHDHEHEHEHEHHHDEHCHCHDHEHEHEHEHHHDEHCHCHDHEHDHDHEHEHHHDEHCHCHEHGHHHHHADEVFTSFGKETARLFEKSALTEALNALDSGKYGTVLRAKGIVAAAGGSWLHFDYVPGEVSVREGSPDVIGRLCVIGAELDETALCELFGI